MITSLRPRIKSRSLADRIINRARQRYLRLRLAARPGIQPPNMLGLFTAGESLELALSGRWPLTPQDVAFIIGRPAEEYRVVACRVEVVE